MKAARLLLGMLLAATAARALAVDERRSEISPDDARLVALVTDPALAEISGFAASRRHAGILWTHQDSGDAARIYALGTDGTLRATVPLRGVENVDFEDIAAFELDGESYLLIADVGDNGGIRRELQLHVLREPVRIEDHVAEIAWTIRFRWPDGPRDCESVAVDAVAGEVLLASKKRVPAELFRVPLRATTEPLVAEAVGLLQHVVQPSGDDLQRNPVYGRYRSQITAIDLHPDGRQLAVLNYLQAYVYTRRNRDEPWRTALRRRPRGLPFPWLAQAEAIAFDTDGSRVWIGTERLPAPLLRLTLPAE